MVIRTTRDFSNSRPLDVHRWSDYPEVNTFIDVIHAEHFSDISHKKTKTHLKVILLDLYLCWLEDEEKSLGVGMSNSFYNYCSRYNSLHLSNHMIAVVRRLHERGLIGLWKGSEWSGKTTRIWASESLVKAFQDAALNEFMVHTHEDKETIILRDMKKKPLEYRDKELPATEAAKVTSMRQQLKEYNEALFNTFIDIPTLEKGYIESLGSGRDDVRHSISHHHKRVYRVFNNSSFYQGGRFYGGWWQNIPKRYRKDIFIDDQSTVEVDYKSIHIMLLYAKLGLDMDEEIKGEDAYTINIPFTNDEEEARRLGKQLLLICVNAKDEKAALKAFRSLLVDEGYGKQAVSLKDKDLLPLIQLLKDKHPKIQDSFCSGAGIYLMNLDAEIASLVLDECLYMNILPLIIHDSFIVKTFDEYVLRQLMTQAVKSVVTATNVKMSLTKNEDLYLSEFLETEELDTLKTSRYKHRLNLWSKQGRARKQYHENETIP